MSVCFSVGCFSVETKSSIWWSRAARASLVDSRCLDAPTMDVVNVGGIVTDVFNYCSRFPKPGESLLAHRITTGCGGKGANQAVMTAKLGAKTAIIGKVGDDIFGREHIDGYKKCGINTDYVHVTKEASTAIACVTVTDSGQNAISVCYAASKLLSPDDVIDAKDMIKSAKVVACQLETTNEATLAVLRCAREFGVRTLLNAAPPPSSPLEQEFFTLSDIFCSNETETEVITGLPVTTIDSAKQAVEILLEKGCRNVIVTLGENGCVFASQDHRMPEHVTARKVQAVDSTGAGDAFVGALCFYLSKCPHLSFREMIRRSSEIATLSVTVKGTQTSYPWARDLPKELLS